MRFTPGPLDTAEVMALLVGDSAVRLIDVRTPAEYASTHIPGSENVPLDQVLNDPQALRGTPVVLVCRSGLRADQAAQALLAAGISQVGVLTGGIHTWQSAGGPVARGIGRPRWDMERQVRLVAGMLMLLSMVASVAFEPLKWVAALVGAGLAVAALTNSCTMGRLLSLLPYNRAAR